MNKTINVLTKPKWEMVYRVMSSALLMTLIIYSSIGILGITATIFLMLFLNTTLEVICDSHIKPRRKTKTIMLLEDKIVVFGKQEILLANIDRMVATSDGLTITHNKGKSRIDLLYKDELKDETIRTLSEYANENDLPLRILTADGDTDEMIYDALHCRKHYRRDLVKPKSEALRVLKWFLIATLVVISSCMISSVIVTLFANIIDVVTVTYMLVGLITMVGIALLLEGSHQADREAIQNCKETYIYFDGELLIIEKPEKKTLRTYSVKRIDAINTTRGYIEIIGNIEHEPNCFEGVPKEPINCLKIPRSFKNEQRVFDLIK